MNLQSRSARPNRRRLRRLGGRNLSARWTEPGRLMQFERPPRQLMPWIVDRGSLTQRLERLVDGRVAVQRVRQQWRAPTPGEAGYLGSLPREACLIRQVQLCHADKAFVLARTVMPRPALTGRFARLRRLGARPLGDILYADRKARRSALEVARLGTGNPLLQGLPGPAWARRSLMSLGRGRAIVIYEVFLEPLLDALR